MGVRRTHPVVDYVGESGRDGRRVYVERDGEQLSLPYCGQGAPFVYAWGRGGIAARELARAILVDATANRPLADRLCREFTWDVIVGLRRDGFRVPRAAVLEWVERSQLPSGASQH